MRNIAFSHTTPQFLAGTKTVTRRQGWRRLRAGDQLQAVDRSMGLRRGESPRKLGIIEIVSVRIERLDAITDEDVRLEGFPDMTAAHFVERYARGFRIRPSDMVTRIEFRKVVRA